MINKKTMKTPKVKSIELNIKDFSKGLNLDDAENVCDMNYNVSCYNFDFKSGALVEGIGFSDASLPNSIEYGCEETVVTKTDDFDYLETWHFKHYSNTQKKRCDKIMFRLSSTLIYCITLFNDCPYFYTINQLMYKEKPYSKNIKIETLDGLIFSSEADGVYSWNGETLPLKRENCPNIVELCLHKNKYFAIIAGEQNYVRYSPNLQVVEWETTLKENEGIIELNDERGPINKLISCFGYLFCVRDYGITKFTTYENSEQINISHVYTSASKIFSGTVCDCGERIIMLTRNGLYKFNGSSCEKINTKLNDLLCKITSDSAIATFRAGVYYIAARINFNDGKTIGCEAVEGYENNVLIAYNVNDNTYSIVRGIDISFMNTIQAESLDKVFFCYKTQYSTRLGEIKDGGIFFEDVSQKYWCSPLSDLGYSNKTKFVKEISLLSKHDCSLTVFTEKESKTFNVKGKDVLTKIPVNLKGKQVGIKIETNQQKAYISNMKLKINLLENKYV